MLACRRPAQPPAAALPWTLARHLSSLESTENDVNVARVQEIRDALASGQLKIDPSRIADGLLASVRDLLK